jgi:pilus assembly protein CpaD
MIRRLAPLGLASLLLAACVHPENQRADNAVTPTELYKLKAEDQADRILLAVHADGLSPAQDEAVEALAARWREGGARAIQISAPTSPVDVAAAYKAAQAVRERLIAQGIPGAAIQQSSYEAAGDPKAPLKVEFTRYQADVPACGRSWENLTATQDNAVQSNFGCAVTANMAVQIADPADIAAPHAGGSVDMGRRVTVMQAYRKGQITSANVDSKASGVVSGAVGGTQ